jgi:hypothetical protein
MTLSVANPARRARQRQYSPRHYAPCNGIGHDLDQADRDALSQAASRSDPGGPNSTTGGTGIKRRDRVNNQAKQ